MRTRTLVLISLMAAFVLAQVASDALAQAASPFGVGRPDGPSGTPSTGIGAMILALQSSFYRELSGAVRAFRDDRSAALLLVGLSLGYGVLHAAGPGHGKAVISSWLLANNETLRRGIGLSFVAAIVQALVAILLVGLLALILGATAQAMDDAALWLERASYAVIALFGIWLVWRKSHSVWNVLATRFGWPRLASGHRHGPDCGHAIAPDADRVAAGQSWRDSLGIVLAIGLRPCTGAIIVLVFALAQGLFLLGVLSAFAMALGTAATVAVIATIAVLAKGLAVRLAAPGSFGASISLGLLELAAAGFVLLVGVVLLAGAFTAPT